MKLSLIKKFTLMACIASGVVIAGGTAQAGAKKQFCKNYANTAVWQYKQSIKLECNFQSPYFHPARGLHKTWCMISPRSAAKTGEAKRASMLSLCQAQGEN